MSAARDDVIREAEQWAAMLRRSGYPDAAVAPEYCIGNEIGSDRFFTRTISVWAGEYKPETIPNGIAAALFSAKMRKES